MANEEEEDDSGNIGVGRYPCMPSLVALQQMRNRLHLAFLGKKLMKWTALATGRELRKIAEDLNQSYQDFSEQIAHAYIMLARSRYFYENLNKMVIENVQKQANITINSTVKSVSAGVKCFAYEINETGLPYPHLGIDKGGQTILETKILWANLLKRMILILQLRTSFSLVDDAHNNATKNQNVVSKVIIPKLIVTIKYITNELEELEREDNFRLKTFNKQKIRRAEKKKLSELVALVCTCCLRLFTTGTEMEDPICEICSKAFINKGKVKAIKAVCKNVGDKESMYLDEHWDEIKEQAIIPYIENFMKPCCVLDRSKLDLIREQPVLDPPAVESLVIESLKEHSIIKSIVIEPENKGSDITESCNIRLDVDKYLESCNIKISPKLAWVLSKVPRQVTPIRRIRETMPMTLLPTDSFILQLLQELCECPEENKGPCVPCCSKLCNSHTNVEACVTFSPCQSESPSFGPHQSEKIPIKSCWPVSVCDIRSSSTPCRTRCGEIEVKTGLVKKCANIITKFKDVVMQTDGSLKTTRSEPFTYSKICTDVVSLMSEAISSEKPIIFKPLSLYGMKQQSMQSEQFKDVMSQTDKQLSTSQSLPSIVNDQGIEKILIIKRTVNPNGTIHEEKKITTKLKNSKPEDMKNLSIITIERQPRSRTCASCMSSGDITMLCSCGNAQEQENQKQRQLNKKSGPHKNIGITNEISNKPTTSETCQLYTSISYQGKPRSRMYDPKMRFCLSEHQISIETLDEDNNIRSENIKKARKQNSFVYKYDGKDISGELILHNPASKSENNSNILSQKDQFIQRCAVNYKHFNKSSNEYLEAKSSVSEFILEVETGLKECSKDKNFDNNSSREKTIDSFLKENSSLKTISKLCQCVDLSFYKNASSGVVNKKKKNKETEDKVKDDFSKQSTSFANKCKPCISVSSEVIYNHSKIYNRNYQKQSEVANITKNDICDRAYSKQKIGPCKDITNKTKNSETSSFHSYTGISFESCSIFCIDLTSSSPSIEFAKSLFLTNGNQKDEGNNVLAQSQSLNERSSVQTTSEPILSTAMQKDSIETEDSTVCYAKFARLTETANLLVNKIEQDLPVDSLLNHHNFKGSRADNNSSLSTFSSFSYLLAESSVIHDSNCCFDKRSAKNENTSTFLKDNNLTKYKTDYQFRAAIVLDKNTSKLYSQPCSNLSCNSTCSYIDIESSEEKVDMDVNNVFCINSITSNTDRICNGNCSSEVKKIGTIEASLYRRVRQNDPSIFRYKNKKPQNKQTKKNVYIDCETQYDPCKEYQDKCTGTVKIVRTQETPLCCNNEVKQIDTYVSCNIPFLPSRQNCGCSTVSKDTSRGSCGRSCKVSTHSISCKSSSRFQVQPSWVDIATETANRYVEKLRKLYKNVGTANVGIATNNITTEEFVPVPSQVPELTSNITTCECKWADAWTITKRSAKYDVRSMADFSKGVKRISHKKVQYTDSKKIQHTDGVYCSCSCRHTFTRIKIRKSKPCKSYNDLPSSNFFSYRRCW